MNTDILLDAIGMVDDHFLVYEVRKPQRRVLRRGIVLIAAVLLFMLGSITALAVSSDLRELVFSILHLQTEEVPPTVTTAPAETEAGALQEFGTQEFDAQVTAHYFTKDGMALAYDGGFYTAAYRQGDLPPDNPCFWQVTEDGFTQVPATRTEFPFTEGDKTFQIIFDHAILNGALALRVWPQGLGEDPYGNGWNVETIGSRTDLVLMGLPVSTGHGYTQKYYLLDMNTLQTEPLFDGIDLPLAELAYCRITEDLRYALLCTRDDESIYWLCDRVEKRAIALKELTGCNITENPYFLDDETIIYYQSMGNGNINVIRRHLPTGIQNLWVQDVPRAANYRQPGFRPIQRHGQGGTHGLLIREDLTIELIDLRTGDRLPLTGLDNEKLAVWESPDGEGILIATEECTPEGYLGAGFSSLGLLDPDTGTVKVLHRKVSGEEESFAGWIGNDRVVIYSGFAEVGGGCYAYVYDFRS